MTKYAGNLTIVDQEWKIYTADAHDPELIADGRACTGTTWCGHFKIFLSNELRGSRLLRTIRHEITHAFIYSSQCEVPETFNEEQICEFVAIYGDKIIEISDEIFVTVNEIFDATVTNRH